MAPDDAPAGRRRALLVATATYGDPGLAALRAPTGDVEALAAVLGDGAIGGFDVTQLVDRPNEQLRQEIESFFGDARPQDLLLLYVSGHGVLSQSRRFYFAATNTSLQLLRSTAIEDGFVNDVMQSSRARSIVLVLDCCHSGAFAKGLVPKSATTVDVEHRFEGRGRVTLSASTELEYAFEESEINELEPAAPGSLFTRSVVEGLRSGEADIDEDGRISVDDLYDYVCRRVRERSGHQTPGMAGDVRGQIVIARSARQAALSPELTRAIDSNMAGIRAGAVDELKALLRAGGPEAVGARAALERLAEDDSRRVAAAALAALGRFPPETVEPEKAAPPQAPPPAMPRRPRRDIVLAGAALLAIVAVVTILALVLPEGGSESTGPYEGTFYDFQGNGTQQVLVAPVNADEAQVVIGPDAAAATQPIRVSSAAAGVPEARAGQTFGTGLVSGDFNGDGHADLAVAAPRFRVVGVRYGLGSGDFKSPPARFTGKQLPRFGAALLARDLNADHYTDLVVGAPGVGNGDKGAVRIIFGSAKGLTMDGARMLEPPPGAASNFGQVLSAGTIDDGETVDLVEGAPDADGHLTFCPGTPHGPDGCRTLPPFGDDNGTSSLTVADLDNDGHGDLIQGDVNVGPGGDDRGGVRLWKGGADGPVDTPTAVVTPSKLGFDPALGGIDAGFGWALDAGAIDDDEFPDIAVGAPGYHGGDGAVVLVRGGPNLVADNQTMSPLTDYPSRLGADVALLYLDSSDAPTLVAVADGGDIEDGVLVFRDNALTPLPGLADLVTGSAEELRIGHNPGAD